MRGCNAVWIPASTMRVLHTQAVVEKELKEKENKTRHDSRPRGARQRIWKWKEQYGNRILEHAS
jgi:valyl-tRNA synthetase